MQLNAKVKAGVDLFNNAVTEKQASEDQIHLLDLASEVLKSIGDQRKQKTVDMFERVVTVAIRDVFDFDYQFRIDVQSQGRVLTRFRLVSGVEELDLMTSCGGGVIDVVSFVLRALMLASIRPQRSRIVFMDESFKHVSGEYTKKVAQLLKSLSEKLDMQFILVTHKQEFLDYADSAYEFIRSSKGTEAKRLV